MDYINDNNLNNLNHNIDNTPLDYQNAVQAQQQLEDLQNMQNMQNSEDLQHTTPTYTNQYKLGYNQPETTDVKQPSYNFLTQQQPASTDSYNKENDVIPSQQPTKSSIVLSTIGFWLSITTLIAIILNFIIVLVEGFYGYDFYNSFIGILVYIITILGLLTTTPGLVCSIIGLALSGKRTQIKKMKSRILAICGIAFAVVAFIAFICFIVWLAIGLSSFYYSYPNY